MTSTTNEFLKATEAWLEPLFGRGGPIKQLAPRMACADGFTMSTQASARHYCDPCADEAEAYTSVEVGHPSLAEELLLDYAEDKEAPTGTVYPHVPVEIVDAVIAKHGGLVNLEMGVATSEGAPVTACADERKAMLNAERAAILSEEAVLRAEEALIHARDVHNAVLGALRKATSEYRVASCPDWYTIREFTDGTTVLYFAANEHTAVSTPADLEMFWDGDEWVPL